MTSHPAHCRPVSRASTCVVALAFAVASLSAAAQIAQQPLTISTSVKPNVMMVLDDSGSMDWEILVPTDDGVFWDSVNHVLADESGVLLRNTDPVRRMVYLFPNGTGAGNKVYNTGNNFGALSPVPEHAFARSSDYNGQYYDPMIEYRPWVNRGGFTFANANPVSAPSDPIHIGNRINLTQTLDMGSSADDVQWRFRVAEGMRNPNDAVRTDARNVAFAYFPATYYQRFDRNLALPFGSYNCGAPDPAAYRHYYTNRPTVQAGLEALGIHAIAPDGHCLVRYEIRPGNAFPSGRTYEDEIQNFANWFTYYRKRHFALRAGLGQTFDTLGGMRIGGFSINNRAAATMWDLAGERDDVYRFFYDMDFTEARGTPNRQALLHAGQQFDTNNSVIEYACQQNFALHFTDGYTDVPASGTITVGNQDGDAGVPYADTYANTIADIAMRYYQGGVRDDLANGRVPVPPQCAGDNPPAWMNCNRDPHMNTYGITLGAEGFIFGQTHQRVRDAYDSPPTWLDPLVKDQTQVDDLFHATVNGRGEMLNARSSVELIDALARAFEAIQDQVLGGAAAVATNSTRLDSGTFVYQARFNTETWSGELLAFDLASDGSVDSQRWDAGSLIPTPNARRIFTRHSVTGEGVPFLWNDISQDQRDALDLRSDGVADGLGQARLNYLRGVRGQEQPGGPFRTRQRVLGDIVNSNPWFVGAQNFGYEELAEGANYQAFRQANQNRRRMLYVGANDGMLHAFDADTGAEQFAYVPSTVFPLLTRLTDPGYSHRYFVDGSPVAGDVFIGGNWRTVLVGSLGAGGRAVYALDVTNPDAFNQNSVLWEFTHPDLGYVIGQPSIVRLHNGRWAAIFGSGYEVGRAARLFVVDIETGQPIRIISTVRAQDEATSVTDNGLSQPFPADLSQNRIVDAVYAGDLYGNMWKFDLCGTNNLASCNSNATSWGVAFSQSGQPRPLITVCASGNVAGPFDCAAGARQPITMRPVVGLGPDNGATVYFGTGKFFEVTDRVVSDTDPVQSVYGVHDTGARVSGRSALRRQSILFEGALHPDSPHNLRVVSNELLESAHRGWFIDLISPVHGFQGERAVANPRLRGGRLIFTTMYPLADPCLGGGEGWLFEVDAATGGRFDYSVFDVNEDGYPDDGDFVEVLIDGELVLVPVSAIQFGFIPTTPAIIEAGAVEYKIISGSTGELETIRERGLETKGRQSWRQIFP